MEVTKDTSLKDRIKKYVEEHETEIIMATACLTVLNTLSIKRVKREAKRRDAFVNEMFDAVANNFDKAAGYFDNVKDHILVIEKAITKEK